MKKENFTPEDSLDLIKQVIQEARNKFNENGFIYMFWGILTAIASLSQFILLKNEHFDINWYPYLLMPIGSIYTAFYFAKRKRSIAKNQIGKIISYTWITISINIMILGFFFAGAIRENLIPIILILLSIGIVISGASIKSKLLIISGLIINISGFIGFMMDWIYQPLLMGLVSITAVFIPGIILMIKHKRKENV
jgi:hypothetical protein